MTQTQALTKIRQIKVYLHQKDHQLQRAELCKICKITWTEDLRNKSQIKVHIPQEEQQI